MPPGLARAAFFVSKRSSGRSRSVHSRQKPADRGRDSQTSASRHRIHDKIPQPRMAARREQLHQFETAGQDDNDDGRQDAAVWIGEADRKTDEDKGERMLAITADRQMGPVARGTEGREGDSRDQQPRAETKKNFHASRLAWILRMASDGVLKLSCARQAPA